MLNKGQIKLVQTAVRTAGLRYKNDDGRYRLLLRQYRQPGGAPVSSCTQLNHSQLEDLLAICESFGWRHPGKAADFYRKKIKRPGHAASFAQQAAIQHLAGDLGWGDSQLAGMIERMTQARKRLVSELTSRQAYNLIEAMKAMFARGAGRRFGNLRGIQREMEVTDDQENQTEKVGSAGNT